jgi:hypothetical protein
MGVSANRAAGAIIFIIIVHIGMILLVGSLGLLMNGHVGLLPFEPSSIGYGLAVGMMLYLTIVYLRFRFMQRYKILAPLQGIGLSGHLRAAAVRLPHVLGHVLTYWGALTQ